MTASRDLEQAASGVPRREAEPVPEMVERVARAILAANPINDTWDRSSETSRAFARREARAAIEAIQEPLEDAAFTNAACVEDVGFNIAQLFDAALSGSRTPPDRQPEQAP